MYLIRLLLEKYLVVDIISRTFACAVPQVSTYPRTLSSRIPTTIMAPAPDLTIRAEEGAEKSRAKGFAS